jgi:hypothetical protein
MHATNTDWRRWRRLFEARADRGLPALEADYDYRQLPPSLARSLAVFQLGESGGGAVVEQARRSGLDGIDADFVRAIELFVAEERRHASILAVCVRLTGGRLIRRNWTASLFVIGRRLMGLRLKILVLLAAEVVGLCFYRLLAGRLPPGRLRRWLLEMVADEESHLQFHCEFIRGQIRGSLGAVVFKATWRVVMALSAWAVLLDHRRTLRDFHIDRKTVRSLWREHRRAVETNVLSDSASGPATRPSRRSLA